MQARFSSATGHSEPKSIWRIHAPLDETWAYIAGLFDGDGTVKVKVLTFTLQFELRITDNYKPFLRYISQTYESVGIKCWFVENSGAWDLGVNDIKSMTKLIDRILPFSRKKHGELEVVRDYLADKITIDEALSGINQAVINGIRMGKVRDAAIPFTRSEGLSIAALVRADALRRSAENRKIQVSEETRKEIRRLYRLGFSQQRIAELHGYERTIIRKILGVY